MLQDLQEWEQSLERFGERAWQAMLLLALLSVGAGAAILVWPNRSTLIMGVLFSMYLILSGVLSIALAIMVPATALLRFFAILAGAAAIFVGVLCLRNDIRSVAILAIFLAVGWIGSGIWHVLSGLFAWSSLGGWAVLSGVVLIVAGLVLLAYPIPSVFALTVIAGVVFLIEGVLGGIGALQLRSVLQRPVTAG